MMHKLFYLGTVAFWLAVAAIWQGSGMTQQILWLLLLKV